MEVNKSIIQRCIRGNRDAQTQLYRSFSPGMFVVCQRYARTREDAEDILQEGFIKVFGSLQQYRFDGSFEGWMRRIFINCALQKYRSQTSLHVISLNSDREEDHSFEEEITTGLNLKELISLVQRLPAGCRMVFNLYVFEGMKHQEIAGFLGISEGTSKSNLFDARKHLQRAVLKERELAKTKAF